jgi:hypothetical protein
VAEQGALSASAAKDVDLILSGDAETDETALVRLVCEAATGDFLPAANRGGFVDFQLSRGLLGVST